MYRCQYHPPRLVVLQVIQRLRNGRQQLQVETVDRWTVQRDRRISGLVVHLGDDQLIRSTTAEPRSGHTEAGRRRTEHGT